MLEHKELLEPGTWKITGEFTDKEGLTFSIEGKVEVKPRPESTLMEWTIKLQNDAGTTLYKTYHVDPFPEGEFTTKWKGEIEQLGKFTGNITMMKESIVITYTSENGELSGMDNLIKIDNKKYRYKGSLLESDGILESWAAQIQKQMQEGI